MDWTRKTDAFESYVIFAGSKADTITFIPQVTFESYVIFAGSKATNSFVYWKETFESYVIFAGSKAKRIEAGHQFRV